MSLLKSPLAVILACMLVACGSKGTLKGQPPQVSISAVTHSGDQLLLDLSIHNINHETMRIQRISFTFSLDESEIRVDQPMDGLSVDRSSTEISSFQLLLPEALQTELVATQAGERPNLPVEIKGSVVNQEGRSLSFSLSSRLYPVPGRPGQFR